MPGTGGAEVAEVARDVEASAADAGEARARVAEPDKIVRIATMVRELLDETRQAQPDERGRDMLRGIYERSIRELHEVLPEELQKELAALAPSMEGTPTESEIRVAQAQLVGWLEGLFHGIQAAVWAQQMAARAQLEEVRRRGLPPGQPTDTQHPPGSYL
jgi:hypothetical protein